MDVSLDRVINGFKKFQKDGNHLNVEFIHHPESHNDEITLHIFSDPYAVDTWHLEIPIIDKNGLLICRIHPSYVSVFNQD
jgi:hypothetical protein